MYGSYCLLCTCMQPELKRDHCWIWKESSIPVKQSIKNVFELLLSIIGISIMIGLALKLAGIKMILFTYKKSYQF